MDEQKFRQIFTEHGQTVFGYAARRVGPDRADDVVADTFLVAWRRRADVPDDRIRAWLLTTARWVIADARRAAVRRDRLLVALPPPEDEPDPAGSLASDMDVRRALASLKAVDQEVLLLCEWDQLSHAEAAAVLGCSAATFAVRLRRARARFARALDGPAPPRLPEPHIPLAQGAIR